MDNKKGKDPNHKQLSKYYVTVATFISGGVAGCCSKTTVAPLDRVKILLQGHNHHYKHLGVFSSIHHVKVKEGILGFYKGNGIQMLRVFPYAAVQFGSFEQYKKIVPKVIGTRHPHLDKFVAGSLAGLTAVSLTYPLDVVRARVAFQVTGEHKYFSFVHALRSIHIEGGIQALYHGIVPTLLGMVPYAGLSFYTFETMKKTLLSNHPELFGHRDQTGVLVLTVKAKLLCGGVAGIVAQTISYPLDVVRRRMQLAGMYDYSQKYNERWYTVLANIYKYDGVLQGLFRGLSINYIRAMPMVAISFSVYELTKQLFGLDTGVSS